MQDVRLHFVHDLCQLSQCGLRKRVTICVLSLQIYHGRRKNYPDRKAISDQISTIRKRALRSGGDGKVEQTVCAG